jgi:FkbM family methyltransferase
MLDSALAGIGRVIGKPPGWERVVRAFAPPQHFAHGTLIDVQRDGYTFPVDRGTIIGWSVHFFGTYEPEVRAEIRRFLEAGGVGVDVGANVGWHTLLMASCVGPSGRVYAFEPNTTTRERLARAAAINRLGAIHVDPRALSDSHGFAAFDMPRAGNMWDATGHLQGQVGRVGQVGQVGQAGQTGLVECVTLDAFVEEQSIRRISLIKIDVEGWELAVLRGGRRVLDTMRPAVIFEFDPTYVSRCGGCAADLTRCLAESGYNVFALNPRRGAVNAGALARRAGNFLALPREPTVRR